MNFAESFLASDPSANCLSQLRAQTCHLQSNCKWRTFILRRVNHFDIDLFPDAGHVCPFLLASSITTSWLKPLQVERWPVPLRVPELCTNPGKAHYVRLVCLQNEIFSFHLKFEDRESRKVLLRTAHMSLVPSQSRSDGEFVRTLTCQSLLETDGERS